MNWSRTQSLRRLRAVATGASTLVALTLLAPIAAQAVQPVVKTVPWVANSPLIPHDAVSGETHILKGTSSVAGATIEYTWDFGDGSVVQKGTVVSGAPAGLNRNLYGIDATHAYSGAAGTVYTATLTVQDTSTGEIDSEKYYVEIRAKSLPVEVNIAIDRGLWFLHKSMVRSNVGGADLGDWLTCPWAGTQCNVALGYPAVTGANTNAFLSNGHLETGEASNPYTETVQRAMRQIFRYLIPYNIPIGTDLYPADGNGNGLGVYVYGSYEMYQSGNVMNAIIATGTPNAVTTTGPPNIIGRSYKSIIQDMVDLLATCQYPNSGLGGWRYSCDQYPDNSANQWVALGIIAAERAFGATVPPLLKTYNNNWLSASQYTDGGYGYQPGYWYPWGPYATTPAGLIQNAMIGQGRGNPKWDKAETFIRDRFCNTGNAAQSIRDYYYGLFSFTKAMLLHDSNGDGAAEPLTLLQSATSGVNPIDWYSVEGSPCDGVARTLVNDQNAEGWWWAHNYEGNQYRFETAWAILMLNRSVFETGNPVAVAIATPNPAVASQIIALSGASSFHQDPARTITSWAWDLDNNGTFEKTGVTTTTSFPAVGDYPVKLKVCDDSTPQRCAETILTIRISTPPLAPTADANGPYNFCANATPWFLNGTGSVNPDEGQSEPGALGDTITTFGWDLDGDGQFDDASGALPNVTAFFTGKGPGAYLVQLQVTDRTATSFPSSGLGNLSDTDSGQVTVRASTDPQCTCVSNLAARPKLTKVQLTWTHLTSAHHYNVYRSTVSGGPYLKIGSTTSTYSTYLDSAVVTGTTYYYVVRPALLNDSEFCQSNQASAKPVAR